MALPKGSDRIEHLRRRIRTQLKASLKGAFNGLGLIIVGALMGQPALAGNSAADHLVVTLGTSLTAADPDPQKNWQVALEKGLEERLGEPVTVVNKGISGGSSQDGIQYVLDDAVALHPEVVTIEYAMNDAYSPYDISLEESEANIRHIVEAFRSADPDVDIFLMTMNPIVPGTPHAADRPNLDAYYDLRRRLANDSDLDVHLIDVTPNWGDATYAKMPDGLHPSLAAAERYLVPMMIEALGDAMEVNTKTD
ncbi:Lysophospholipase L1 [Fulvimarina manganoxydans]|uniref:Lysophospholipase L1 n=1 Tax=Fulvimarina manganoxydans TaxID=937218 RepID=A0A1W1YF40_9HYPH|nr:Lysophospholipase L1 [Fulvimarina manganoxydans]